MPTFIADATLQAALENVFKVDPGSLQPYWLEIITDANIAAYQDVVTRLLARGFTAAQAQAFDRGAEFERSIGLYYCLVNGGAPENYALETIRLLDRRGELGTVTVTVNNVVQIAGGTVNATEQPFTPIGSGRQQAFDDLVGFSDCDGWDSPW